MKKLNLFGIVFLLLLSSLKTAWALPENVDINGFFQTQGTFRTTGNDDFVIFAEERLQLIPEFYQDFNGWGSFRVFGKFDFVVDETDILNDPDKHMDMDIVTRELFADWSLGLLDIRIGRQIITWGIGNRIFVNDVFPKSWVSLFSGRPLQYLKTGSDAVKLNYYPKAANFELIIIPIFEPDNFPKGKRLDFFDSAPTLDKSYDEPKDFRDIQLGLRIQKTFGKIDWNLYAYRGYYSLQGKGFYFIFDNNGIPRDLIYTSPPLHTYGFSGQGSLFNGIAGFEAAYNHSVDDQDGDDPTVENSTIKTLITYEEEAAKDLIIGVQYNLEYMVGYDDYRKHNLKGLPDRHLYTHFLALDINQKFFNNTIVLSFFMTYGIRDSEIFINPEIKYHINDNWWMSCGFNVFEGKKKRSTLGQFNDNDNVYLITRYSF